MNDEKILDLYWARSEDALIASDEKYGAYCYAVAFNILSEAEDSEECVNDTWFRAWNSIPPQRPKFLRQFFAKITRNLAIDRYRKCARRSEASAVIEELSECVSDKDTIESELQRKAFAESLNRFLRNLPERECSIFLRRYFYAEGISVIANRCRMKEDNIYTILSRIRKKLKAHLEEEGFEL